MAMPITAVASAQAQVGTRECGGSREVASSTVKRVSRADRRIREMDPRSRWTTDELSTYLHSTHIGRAQDSPMVDNLTRVPRTYLVLIQATERDDSFPGKMLLPVSGSP